MKKLMIFLIGILYAKELIFYCGITMAKDMENISKLFERTHNVKIKIIPGASKELLLIIKKTKKGDLYLPGSAKYILDNKSSFTYFKPVGYNRLVLVRYKNKRYTFEDLLNNRVATVLCNYETSSCGRATKKFIEKKYGVNFYNKLFDNAVEITMDSKPLNRLILQNNNLVGINWKASVKNKNLRTVEIGAEKSVLYLAVIKYSDKKKLAEEFVNFVYKNNLLKKRGFN